VVVSNSGASCVLAADRAEAMAMPVPELAPATRAELADILPGFATTTNPVDITAALLSDSGLFSAILPVIGRDPDVDLCFAALPVLGTGYDLPRLARDSAAFADATGIPLAVASPQAEIAAVFRAAGVPTFDTEGDAMRGLDQLARHAALLRRVRRAPPNGASVPLPAGSGPFLSEAASLRLLADRGFPVVRWHLCGGEADAIAAFHAVGGPVVVKACSADVPHKSEHGLVTVGIADEAGVAAAFRSQWAKLGAMGVRREGILVAAMAHGRHEFMLGARRDPHFGPVVVVGDGGRYVEALRDFCLLVPPFETADVREALDELRIAPLYAGVRGEPPLDIDALCALAVRLGDLILDAGPSLASVDINPVIVGARGEGVVIVDALVERGGPA
jgi:acyl-CoA synthetase (NDP forming)